jgi:hypothetical protein
MSRILLTYDVKNDHVEIKKKLLAVGWVDQMPAYTEEDGSAMIINLPNTSLMHQDTTTKQAIADLRLTTTGSNIIRLVAFEIPHFLGLMGAPHKDDE